MFEFVSARIGLNAVDGMQGIGLEHNGTLVAGAIYEGINAHNAWVHLAGEPGRKWLNRQFLHAGFIYPFIQCGVSRLRGYVEASNTDAIRFDEHVGFRREAILTGAAKDGGDVIIYVMKKEDCRYLGLEQTC